MRDERYRNMKKQKIPAWLIPVLSVVLALLVILLVFLELNVKDSIHSAPTDPKDNTTVQTDSKQQTDLTKNQQTAEDTTDTKQTSEDTKGTEQTDAPTDSKAQTDETTTKATEQTDAPVENVDPTDAADETTAPTQSENEDATQPSSDVVQAADAEYEKWLSAAMVVCVSMEYPDFQLDGVYAASATKLDDKFSSDGAYVIFTTGGTQMAIHSIPLENERTESGTVDISSEMVGYATFDEVELDSLDTSSFAELEAEELSELISQSLLVSIYER